MLPGVLFKTHNHILYVPRNRKYRVFHVSFSVWHKMSNLLILCNFLCNLKSLSWGCWSMPGIPATGRSRKEDQKLSIIISQVLNLFDVSLNPMKLYHNKQMSLSHISSSWSLCYCLTMYYGHISFYIPSSDSLRNTYLCVTIYAHISFSNGIHHKNWNTVLYADVPVHGVKENNEIFVKTTKEEIKITKTLQY